MLKGLLLFFVFFIEGQHCFFIKHSGGLCINIEKMVVYGNITDTAVLSTDCLGTTVQFRYTENGGILHLSTQRCIQNTGPNVTISHDKVNVNKTCPKTYAIKHTSNRSLLNSYTKQCFVPKAGKNGTNVGDVVAYSHECDKEKQQFIFGVVICERWATSNANCHPNQTLAVQKAYWGGRRDVLNLCSKHAVNADKQLPSVCVVKRLCDGTNSCNGLKPKNVVFGNDPASGFGKHLYMEYLCVDHPEAIEHYFVQDVSLTSSGLPNEGIIQINIDNKMKTKVCAKSLGSVEKEVICRQLGYSGVKLENVPDFVNGKNWRKFSGHLSCSGQERTLYECCVTNTTKDRNCSSVAYVSCILCSDALLEDRINYPDERFTASNFAGDNSPAKARLTSNSSWCASPNGNHHLDIDLGEVHFINSVATFGDAASDNWVNRYILNYTEDGNKWMTKVVSTKMVDRGSFLNVLPFNIRTTANASNYADTTILPNITAKILRFIPQTYYGHPCMRIEICGRKARLPEEPSDLTITDTTSSTVRFSWSPPLKSGDKAVSRYRIKVRKIGAFIFSIEIGIGTNATTIEYLSPFNQYQLLIAAANEYGFGKEKRVNFTTTEAAPTAPPRGVTVVAQSTSSLSVSWKQPEEGEINGIITNYNVCISLSNGGTCLKEYTTTNQSLIVANLSLATRYFARVSASTKVGSGGFSSSQQRYTNSKALDKAFNETSTTLTFMLQLPRGNFSYIQVIALKLLDGKTPNTFPDSYSESDLLKYAQVMDSYAPKPYIAAVFSAKLNEWNEKFVLGDGSSYSLSIGKRSSSSDIYYNTFLQSDSQYTIFQRIYVDQDGYYSSGWSPIAQTKQSKPTLEPPTLEPPTLEPTTLEPTTPNKTEASACGECSKIPLYIVIAIAVAIIVMIVIALSWVCHSHQRLKRAPQEKVTTNSHIENQAFTSDEQYDDVEISPTVQEDNVKDKTYTQLNEQRDDGQHPYQGLNAYEIPDKDELAPAYEQV